MKILRLQKLKVLDLSHNDLTCLPEELGMLSLECLYLSHNKFGETPACDPRWNWISGFRLANSLEVLDLSHNEVFLEILSLHVHCLITFILFFLLRIWEETSK
jgi:Leucine-rich repeat (LRR) protein